jgi:hypothetical protein
VLAPRLQVLAGRPGLVVDTEQNSGRFVSLALLEMQAQLLGAQAQHLSTEEVGPGVYAASLPTAQSGVYRVTVRRIGSALGQTVALVAVPYAQEYVPATPDRALLSQLASASGGAVLTDPQQVMDVRAAGGVTSDQDLWWGLAVLALAFFMADVALRQSGWGRVP